MSIGEILQIGQNHLQLSLMSPNVVESANLKIETFHKMTRIQRVPILGIEGIGN